MVPKRSKSKPSIDQAMMEWGVIVARVLDMIESSGSNPGVVQLDKGKFEYLNTAAIVAAEIWKGVDHGDDA